MDRITKHKRFIILVLLACSLLWAIISTVLFFSDYRTLRRSGYLPGPHSWHAQHIHNTPTQGDVDAIESWMTFSFLNTIFHIPAEYFREKLSISDTRYPKMTISQAAKASGTPSPAMLQTVKTLLSEQLLLTASSSIQ